MARSSYAADDFDTIRRRLGELTEAVRAGPTCPVPSRPLRVHDCLRSPAQCPDACPLRGDWIGPQP